jgi:hypothetical protein
MPSIEITPRSSFDCDRYPDECPICHTHVHATLKLAQIIGAPMQYGTKAGIEAVFLCPNEDCKRFFITYYLERPGTNHAGNGTFRYTRVAPMTPVAPAIFEAFKILSPNFCEIFTQASEAEMRGLDQVAGVGYRKALEFLIKDYCISKHPDHEAKIKTTALGPCIDTYVKDENIKDCAKLATWLGNDETHYVRKWDDKDINDLKALISLTSSWIETGIRTDAYRSAMLTRSA